jgi:glyceraldehyde-3-phosphate dehydrogenase/erythrose-4-phosphate dehydrogenase
VLFHFANCCLLHAVLPDLQKVTGDCTVQNVDLVIEGTGVFVNSEGAGKHLQAGAKKVTAGPSPFSQRVQPVCTLLWLPRRLTHGYYC